MNGINEAKIISVYMSFNIFPKETQSKSNRRTKVEIFLIAIKIV